MPELKDLLELIQKLIAVGNLAQAEIVSQMGAAHYPEDPNCNYLLGIIAMSVKDPKSALRFFNRAAAIAPDWSAPHSCIKEIQSTADSPPSADATRFLLIKAWGYGFWSDVDHVLGQLLVSEITGRVPIVHWGSNSRYGDKTHTNHFNHYFEPLSTHRLESLQKNTLNYFPGKWNRENLLDENLNKFSGPDSCMAALYSYAREEAVVVSDFYTRILNILPYLPPEHPDFGKAVDPVYRRLVKKYLRPRKIYLDRADQFVRDHIGTEDFLSVHMRGSDKVKEVHDLEKVNRQYFERIDAMSPPEMKRPIFLMTDDLRLLNDFRSCYGERVVSSDCTRTSGELGLHVHEDANGYKLGEEMLLDTCIALRGTQFIGNGFSNPSAMISHLKDWRQDAIFLIDDNIHHCHNITLHSRPIEDLDPRRAAMVWRPKNP